VFVVEAFSKVMHSGSMGMEAFHVVVMGIVILWSRVQYLVSSLQVVMLLAELIPFDFHFWRHGVVLSAE
jgi:hypothetical protein